MFYGHRVSVWDKEKFLQVDGVVVAQQCEWV